jgi:hypothetical protein
MNDFPKLVPNVTATESCAEEKIAAIANAAWDELERQNEPSGGYIDRNPLHQVVDGHVDMAALVRVILSAASVAPHLSAAISGGRPRSDRPGIAFSVDKQTSLALPATRGTEIEP